MKPVQIIRNICIGIIDGITIPLALVAGLTQLEKTPATIIVACIAVIIGGSVTMATGGYMEAKKYEPSSHNLPSALLIGLSYFCGGLLVTIPFLFFTNSEDALIYSVIVSVFLLTVAGYLDSSVNNSAGWKGAVRVVVTGLLAATAAYLVAGMF